MPTEEDGNSNSNRESEDEGKHDSCACIVRDANTVNYVWRPRPRNCRKVRESEDNTISTGNCDIEEEQHKIPIVSKTDAIKPDRKT